VDTEITAGSVNEILCDTLILGLVEGIMVPDGAIGIIDKALTGNISTVIRDQPDCGKYGETNVLYTWGSIGAKNIILLGLGKKEELTTDKIRALSAIATRIARKLRSKSVASIVFENELTQHEPSSTAQAIIEGAILGTYKFQYYKTEKNDLQIIEKFIIIANEPDKIAAMKEGVHNAKIIAESVNLARDLSNHPAQYMTPTKMAWHAAEIAKKTGIELTILTQQDMEEQQMHALLAVAQGSVEPPKMIILKYTGDVQSNQITAFVGKGITFDSGGISLKPSENMGAMKGDMAGGAAVLGAMLAVGQFKPNTNILGIIPCTENMPSGQAFKPGDVISSMSGKTIEIISTDAEGRLILADAITYARKLGANKIVDIATLTGACVVALGNVASGAITNNSDWYKQVLTAANQTGEKLWELPNFDEYKEQFKSDIADLKNTGGRMAGAITAGLFIAEFADNIPWVHIDIAGTADSDKVNGYSVKGATGTGVRTLIQLAQTINPL
jgi:leucyl aminopeptidase